jgi:hypothetical protein
MKYSFQWSVILFFTLFLGVTCAHADRRAFLIGISDYESLKKLDNPTWDIDAIKQKLQSVGFQVSSISTRGQTTYKELLKSWTAFLKTVNKNDEVVVYYSGHGVDIRGANLLVPSDSPTMDQIGSENLLLKYLIPFQSLFIDLENYQVSIQVWIIDACRENPFSVSGKSVGAPGGLSQIPTLTKNSLFVFLSANYNQIARDRLPTDGPNDHGSPYTRTFVGMFDEWANKPINQFGHDVGDRVRKLVEPYPQFPMYADGVLGSWCFNVCDFGTATVTVQSAAQTKPKEIKGTVNTVTARADELTHKPDEPIANAIFLGKKSSRNCSFGPISNNYPFGCDVAKVLAASGGNYIGLLGKPLQAYLTVNLRKQLPTVVSDRNIVYPCTVGTVDPGQVITLKGIVAIAYLQDVFYWGLLPGVPKNCKDAKDPDDVGMISSTVVGTVRNKPKQD